MISAVGDSRAQGRLRRGRRVQGRKSIRVQMVVRIACFGLFFILGTIPFCCLPVLWQEFFVSVVP